MAKKHKPENVVSANFPIIRYISREAMQRGGGTLKRLEKPVELFCKFFATCIEGKMIFPFFDDSPWKDASQKIDDQRIIETYNLATAKKIPVTAVMRLHAKQLPVNRVLRTNEPARDMATAVNYFGQRVWFDPYNREAKIIEREPGVAPEPVDELHRRLFMHLEEPLRERLHHVPDVNIAGLVAETIAETFYLYFLAALNSADARVERLTPFIELLVQGLVPIGDRFSPDLKPACIVLVD